MSWSGRWTPLTVLDIVSGDVPRAYAAEQMVLEIKAYVCFTFLKRFKDLVQSQCHVFCYRFGPTATFMASAVTSGPQWSPAKTTMLYEGML